MFEQQELFPRLLERSYKLPQRRRKTSNRQIRNHQSDNHQIRNRQSDNYYRSPCLGKQACNDRSCLCREQCDRHANGLAKSNRYCFYRNRF